MLPHHYGKLDICFPVKLSHRGEKRELLYFKKVNYVKNYIINGMTPTPFLTQFQNGGNKVLISQTRGQIIFQQKKKMVPEKGLLDAGTLYLNKWLSTSHPIMKPTSQQTLSTHTEYQSALQCLSFKSEQTAPLRKVFNRKDKLQQTHRKHELSRKSLFKQKKKSTKMDLGV